MAGPRHERKLTVPAHLLSLVESRIALHPGGFRRAHPPRRVNSLYFDSPTLDRLGETVEGLGWRSKVRIRWYGEVWGRIERPVLEVKSKTGHAGSKRLTPLPPFELTRASTRRTVLELLAGAPESAALGALEPVLLTRYERRYQRAAAGGVRLTIDRDVRYLAPPGPRGFTGSWRRDPDVVLELKYDVAEEGQALDLAEGLGLRLTRNSKFVRGLRAVAG